MKTHLTVICPNVSGRFKAAWWFIRAAFGVLVSGHVVLTSTKLDGREG